MKRIANFKISIFLALHSGFVLGQENKVQQPVEIVLPEISIKATHDPHWIDYRDLYKAYRELLGHSGEKSYIKPMIKIWPKDENISLEGLRLQLIGETISQGIALEGLWAEVPFSQTAFDERAQFKINRKAGSFEFGRWLTIKTNAADVYSEDELLNGCNQVLKYHRLNLIFRVSNIGKKCVGVRFVFQKSLTTSAVKIRKPNVTERLIDDGNLELKFGMTTATYRFSNSTDGTEIITAMRPTAILTIFE